MGTHDKWNISRNGKRATANHYDNKKYSGERTLK